LGISITTHGHHLNPELIRRLRGNVSTFVSRFDAPEPIYSAIRGRPLSRVEQNVQAIEVGYPSASTRSSTARRWNIWTSSLCG
jgi:hypothetical protein